MLSMVTEKFELKMLIKFKCVILFLAMQNLITNTQNITIK